MSWLAQIKGWVLDVDGCLVRTSRPGGAGGNAVPGAVEFVTALKQAGHRVLVCTNASERPPLVYADHLRELGFPITDEDFVTAGSAGADHIAAHHPGAAVVAVGGDGITWPLLERGLSLCDGRTPQECAAVLVGAAPAYSRDQLNAACVAVEAGATLYVSQNQPWFHGGAGRSIAVSAVIAAAISWVTKADALVTGKPSPVLAEALLRRLGLPADRIAVVGDAPAEIELAKAMDARCVAVLSGALRIDQIADLGPELRPDVVVADVAELHQQLTSRPTPTPGVLS